MRKEPLYPLKRRLHGPRASWMFWSRGKSHVTYHDLLHRLFSPLPSHSTDYSTLAPNSMVSWRIIIIIHPPQIAGINEYHCCHLCLTSCYYQCLQVFLQDHHFTFNDASNTSVLQTFLAMPGHVCTL